jgi:uncharacterized membrane protein
MEAYVITDPINQFALLSGLAALVFALGEVKAFARFFNIVPPLVFCYFLPMFCTTIGILPNDSPVYDLMVDMMLPALLLLLLISADIPGILRLGWVAIAVMVSGTLGVMVGTVVGVALFRGGLPPDGPEALAALVGSWTGGSANLSAVAGMLDLDRSALAPVLLLDPIFVYSWLGMLLFFSKAQPWWARKINANHKLEEALHAHAQNTRQIEFKPLSTGYFVIILGMAIALGALMMSLGVTIRGWLDPLISSVRVLKESLSAYTIGIVLVTLLGIAMSFTRARDLEQHGASRIGYGLLYLMLPAFGAKADLSAIGDAMAFVGVALLMIFFHALFLIMTMLLLRTPLFFGAVSSQANLGGPASASIVAAAYAPPLAPVGVLLGILGGIMGTYAGLSTGLLFRALGW